MPFLPKPDNEYCKWEAFLQEPGSVTGGKEGV